LVSSQNKRKKPNPDEWDLLLGALGAVVFPEG
jgi:hypothetical protein